MPNPKPHILCKNVFKQQSPATIAQALLKQWLALISSAEQAKNQAP